MILEIDGDSAFPKGSSSIASRYILKRKECESVCTCRRRLIVKEGFCIFIGVLRLVLYVVWLIAGVKRHIPTH